MLHLPRQGPSNQEVGSLDLETHLGCSSPICDLIITRAQKASNPLKELPFYDEELESGPVQPKKSRAKRRREKFLGSTRSQHVQRIKPVFRF